VLKENREEKGKEKKPLPKPEPTTRVSTAERRRRRKISLKNNKMIDLEGGGQPLRTGKKHCRSRR